MKRTLLLIDDDINVLSRLKRALHQEPYVILTAACAEEAAEILREHAVDVIVSDEHMPGMRGTEFLVGVAREYPDTVRIVLTGQPTLNTAVRAINDGRVYQFLTKPCNYVDLALTIRDAMARGNELSHTCAGNQQQQPDSLLQRTRLFRRLRGAQPTGGERPDRCPREPGHEAR